MTVAYATLPSFVSCASKTGTPGVPHFANAHRPRLQNMQPAVGSCRQFQLPRTRCSMPLRTPTTHVFHDFHGWRAFFCLEMETARCGFSQAFCKKSYDFCRNACKSHMTFVIILAKVIGLLQETAKKIC